MNIMRKLFICMFVVFIIATIPPNLIASYSSNSKLELQKETQDLLVAFEELAYSTQKIKALFTTQDPQNISAYKDRYCRIGELLIQLDKNREEWEKKIKESKNDKVYRLYLAAVQTALYATYSRPNKYIEFLKFKEPITLTCRNPLPENVIQTFEDLSKDWEIKADTMMQQALININKALDLDPDYEDAQILKAQLYTLKGQFDQSLSIFDDQEKKEVFKEILSLLNSWKAFIELKKGNLDKGKKLLRLASAYSSPVRYSKWASTYLKSLIRKESVWIEYDFLDFIPLNDIDLEKLKMDSLNAMSTINQQLMIPLDEIPESPNPEKLKSLSKAPASNIFWDLETDRSQQNLERYAIVIENLYNAGYTLEYCINKWNQLALNNNKLAYYYLLQKSHCSLSLSNMAEKTKNLLKNERLMKMLKDSQLSINEQNRKIDYAAKSEQWSRELRVSFEMDIKEILSQKPDFIYAQVLDFEFSALFSSPQEAIDKLEKISEVLRNRHIKTLPIYAHISEIDSLSYIYAWRSFLDLKEGKNQSALEYMQRTGRGLENWQKNQEKLIQIKNMASNQ